jgi:hypothetical protein
MKFKLLSKREESIELYDSLCGLVALWLYYESILNKKSATKTQRHKKGI